MRRSSSPERAGRAAIRRGDLLVLAAILLTGLTARILYLDENRRSPDFAHPAVDALFHDYWARGLATGEWIPPAGSPDPRISKTPYFRPPGYPYFLALVYRLSGGSYVAPRLAQIFLGLLSAAVAFLIGARWFGASVGLLAGAGLAFYWPLLFFEGELHAPALLNGILLPAVYLLGLWAEALPAARRRWLFLSGAAALLGLASLVLPNVLALVPVVGLWTAWLAARHGAGRRSWAAAGVVAGVALVVVAPATLRNWIVAHEFVPISSNGGVNLYIGNHAGATGFVVEEIPDLGPFGTCFDYPGIVQNLAKKLGRPLRYSEVSSWFAAEAARFVRQNPGAALHLLGRKILLFWGPMEIGHNKEIECERQNSWVLRSLPGDFPAVLALGIIGFLLLGAEARRPDPGRQPLADARRRWDLALLLGAMILVLSFSYLPFFVADRYRAPIIPFLILLAAPGVHGIAARVRARRPRPAAAWGAAGAGLYVALSVVPQGYVPDLAQWHYGRGIAYLAGERRPEAEVEFREALRVEPRHARSHYNLGTILAQQGKMDEAMAHWREVVRLRADLPEPYNNLGAALLREGKRDEAIAALRDAVRLRPESAEFHANLGRALVAGGRAEEGVAELGEALRLDPSGEQAYDVHVQLGDLLLSQRRIADSLQHYRRALLLHDDAKVANNVAWLLATHPDAACRDGAEAVHLAEHVCASGGDAPFPFFDTLAAAYAEAGKFEQAVTTITKAIDLAESAQQAQAVQRLTERLHLYERRLPYRDPSLAGR